MHGNAPMKHIEISIRQDLQCFVDTLLSHICNTILQPASQRMSHNMSKAEDIDEMAHVHEAFITSIQTQCLLTKNLNPIYHSILSLLEVGVRFTDLRRQALGRTNSTTDAGKLQKRKARRRSSLRPSRALEVDTSESSDGGFESNKDQDYDADSEKLSGNEGSYSERLKKLKDEVLRLRNFVVTGLKGISRTGGEPTWEMLAEQLDWGSFGVH
jgi:gamma-tubulin complex component 5